MKPTFFKGIALGAATCFVMLAVTSALAGTGIGDVFNLGQVNSVDDTSTLQGNVPSGAQLFVKNQGAGAGVRGEAAGGRGVVGAHTGAAGTNAGVEGDTSSDDNAAVGVLGRILSAAPGMDSAAVRGINPSTQAGRYGVWGSVAGSGFGVFGDAKGGSGVHGEATTGTGVLGTADTGIALRGLSSSGRGVQGQNLSSTRSVNGDQPGVFGTAFADDGGQFVSAKGNGACAASGTPCPNTTGVGLYAISTDREAVVAKTTTSSPLLLDGPAGVPPMAVTSSVKVASLNADRLDGHDSSEFVPRGKMKFYSVATVGKDTSNGSCDANDTCYATFACPAGETLLIGGYDGVDPGTFVEASHPNYVPGSANWRMLWKNDGSVDTIVIRIMCAGPLP
jgi:hypothetical protein